jgi:8-oxo-dGTP pyrophosphatase MutT (NUDIX family)
MLAVTGVCFEGGKLLLVRDNHGFWAGVGGWVEPGESPEDALRREVKEELGVEAKVTHVLRPFIAWNVSSAEDPVNFLLFVYGMRVNSNDFALQEGEVTAVQWVPEKEWSELDMLPYVRALFDDRIAEWMRASAQ